MDIELRHLRAFAAVAEVRSFTAASRRLLITQPALTRTLQQLERILGVELLERTSRSVQVTPAGGAFLARVQRVLADLDGAVVEARGGRVLRVGFSWVLPDPWASETIAEFEAVTGVPVHLTRSDDSELALERGDLDAALLRSPPRMPGLTVRRLFDEPRVAAVSVRSPLAERDRIDWAELAEFTVVVNSRSGSTHIGLWPAEARPDRVVECANYDEWITLIAAGRGVGATSSSAARTYAHPGIVYVPLDDAPAVGLFLAWDPRGDTSLIRRLVEVAEAHRPQ